MVRARLYLRWFLAVLVLSLIPAILIPDIIEGGLRLRPSVPADRVVARIYDMLTAGPQRAAELLMGFNIGSHAAQAWPPGLPPWLAHHVKMCMIFTPFWFAVGVPFLELFLFMRRRRQISIEARA